MKHFAISTLLLLLLFAGAAIAAEPGPHAVGFRIHQWIDATRAYDSWPDAHDDAGRPLRVFEWYPATTAGDTPVRWADYVALDGDVASLDGGEPSEEEREALLATFRLQAARRYELDEAHAERMLEQTTGATRNARIVSGRHPAIILNAMPHTLGLLAEHLASHGFVVFAPAAMAEQSRHALRFFPDPVLLDHDVRDLQFVAGELRGLDYVDGSRLGAAAFSSGTLAPLLWQMRDQRLGAIVSFEGWERFLRGVEELESSPWYRPQAMRVPVIRIEKQAEERDEAYAKSDRAFDAMPYADRWIATFPDAAHGSFASAQGLASTIAGDALRSGIHDEAMELATNFFLASLGVAERTLSSGEHFSLETRGGAPPVPTETELARMLERREWDRIRGVLSGKESFAFSRSKLKRVISNLPLAADRLAGLRLLAELFPTETWAWIDVGGACEDLEDAAGASAAYERALTVLDADASIGDERRESLRGSLVETLEKLGSD